MSHPILIAPTSPLTDLARSLIAGSQAALLEIYPPDQIFSLTAEELAATQGMTFYTATRDGTGLGCVASLDCGDYVEVKRLYVAPAGRGTGLARALMARLEDDARKAGKSAVMLETGPDLLAATALYRALGYAERGPFGDYPPHPASLFMQKHLG